MGRLQPGNFSSTGCTSSQVGPSSPTMRGGAAIFRSTPAGLVAEVLETEDGTWQALSSRSGRRVGRTAFMEAMEAGQRTSAPGRSMRQVFREGVENSTRI